MPVPYRTSRIARSRRSSAPLPTTDARSDFDLRFGQRARKALWHLRRLHVRGRVVLDAALLGQEPMQRPHRDESARDRRRRLAVGALPLDVALDVGLAHGVERALLRVEVRAVGVEVASIGGNGVRRSASLHRQPDEVLLRVERQRLGGTHLPSRRSRARSRPMIVFASMIVWLAMSSGDVAQRDALHGHVCFLLAVRLRGDLGQVEAEEDVEPQRRRSRPSRGRCTGARSS